MTRLVHTGQAPEGARAPIPVDRNTIFTLDVDDVIWQDVGLDQDDAGGPVTAVPAWLSNEAVRRGIRGMLKADRVHEENERLIHETVTLRAWADAEWETIRAAKLAAGERRSDAACFESNHNQ